MLIESPDSTSGCATSLLSGSKLDCATLSDIPSTLPRLWLPPLSHSKLIELRIASKEVRLKDCEEKISTYSQVNFNL